MLKLLNKKRPRPFLPKPTPPPQPFQDQQHHQSFDLGGPHPNHSSYDNVNLNSPHDPHNHPNNHFHYNQLHSPPLQTNDNHTNYHNNNHPTSFELPPPGEGIRPGRVGSILLQSTPVTDKTFRPDLDLASIANPSRYSTLKQYLFASLLFKPLLGLILDIFSLVFLAAWVKDSLGKANSSGLVCYGLATGGSMAIVIFGGWRAWEVLKKGNIQGIFVNREAYRWVCLTSRDRFLFFERLGQGYGNKDAMVFFSWFTLQDWMQHLLCDLPRLIINCTIIATVSYQNTLKDKNEPLTVVLPELTALTHFALACNIMLQLCNLVQFLFAFGVLIMVRRRKLITLRKDEHLHTYCQRNLAVRITRLYKLAKHDSTAPLRDHNHLEQQADQYRAEGDTHGGIDLSAAAIPWDTDTQDDHIDYTHYAYRPRPVSQGPPSRPGKGTNEEGNGAQRKREGYFDGHDNIEMAEKASEVQRPMSAPLMSGVMPTPGSFSYAQMQHLQLQKQLYGENRELYETMEWSPPTSLDSSHQGPGFAGTLPSQHQLQQKQELQQQQQHYQHQQQHAWQPPMQQQRSMSSSTHSPPPVPAKDHS